MAVSPHLVRLGARSRPAGSAAAAAARAYCAQVLGTAGFVTTEHSFEYSDVAGRWATPAAGVVAAVAGVGLHVGRRAPPLAFASVGVLVIGGAVLQYVGARGVLEFPARRRHGVNLQAARTGDEPTVWLLAHLDSKWQPVSMIARVLGVVVTTIGLLGLITVALTHVEIDGGVAAGLVLLTLLGACPLMLSIVGSKNDGALDNASGVAAVLEAAEAIPASARVGVLVTDAEELGLAGARAWSRGRVPGVALNCDSIDDIGQLTAMYSRPAPTDLIARLRQAALDNGEELRVIRLIPGVLTDHVPLANAGWRTLTLSRGCFRTLGRVHTSRDTLQSMQGTGIAAAARILACIATELG